MPVTNPTALIDDRVRAIRDYHEANRFARAEMDVSGGVDSATMLKLVCAAVGAEHVTAVFTGIHSSQDSLDRARASAAACDVGLIEVELTQMFSELTAHLLDAAARAGHDREGIEAHIAQDPTVLGSFRSCLRAPIGRGLNRMLRGGVRHGTGNECEDRFLRFYQKGGDGEVDSNPISMLSKGEVFQLAGALDVPASVLDAVPSPDLHGTGEAHNDEDELAALYGVPWTYSRVDRESGKYTFVGTIERMSRLLDEPGIEAMLFCAAPLADEELAATTAAARRHAFAGFDPDAIRALVLSARHIERVTRHKYNPNCPSLGNRNDLVRSDILTDELPAV